MKKIFIILIPVLFWGCATILGGDQQWINFVSQCNSMAQPAHCVASNDRGRWEFQTSARIKILKSATDLTLVCASTPVDERRYKVQPHPSVLAIGNALIGGGIGVLHDLNSATAFEYPDNVSLPGPACAFDGAVQTISVSAQCKGRPMNTVCEAINDKGRWRFETPATFQINKSQNTLRISCQGGLLGDYKTQITAAEESALFSPNLINATPADKNDNGYVKYRYPEQVTLEAPLCKMF
jgi:hypothetical protein